MNHTPESVAVANQSSLSIPWYLSAGGFSLIVLASTLLVGLLFFVLKLIYNPEKGFVIGIRMSVVSMFELAFIPVVVTTATGFRNVALAHLAAVGGRPMPQVRIVGAAILYIFASFGILGALASVLLASFVGLTDDKAKDLIQTAAILWGFTTGYVFERFFKSLEPKPTE